MLIVGTLAFKLTLFIFGRISAADNGSVIISAAGSIGLESQTGSLKFEIPLTVIFYKYFDILMKKIPSDMIVVLFCGWFINF